MEEDQSASPAQLFAWFDRDGATIGDEHNSGTLERAVVGEVAFPSGEIVCCDPFYGPNDEHLAVAPGTTGSVDVLQLALTEKHVRVCAARLTLSAGAPQTWDLLRPDDADDEYGYGVDSAMSCFADRTAAVALADIFDRFYNGEGDDVPDHEPLRDELAANAHRFGLALVDSVPVAAFESGYGDGSYGAWVGRDAAGAPLCVLTSFSILAADAVVS